MEVKTVLTYFDGSSESEERFRSAMEVARWFDADLSVACIAYVPEFRRTGQYAPDIDALRVDATENARDRARRACSRLEAENVRGVAFAFITTRGDFERQFEGLSHYADVTVRSGSHLLPQEAASLRPTDQHMA